MTLRSTWATRGMVVAPHALAAESGLAVLREGGNALEAMIAAAATISVVYPHMNGIGGDGFWLIHEPGREVTDHRCLRPRRRAPRRASATPRSGSPAIPYRGAARRQHRRRHDVRAGALAHEISRTAWAGRLPLARLLADAIHYAERRHASSPQARPLHRGQARRAARPARLRGTLPARRRRCPPPVSGSAAAAHRGDAARSSPSAGSTISTAANSRARSRRPGADRQPARARRSRSPRRRGAPAGAARSTASARSTTWRRRRRASVSLAILGILDRLGLAKSPVPRPTAPTTCTSASRRPSRRSANPRPPRHRPGVHDGRSAAIARSTPGARAARAGRGPRPRGAVGRGSRSPATPCGWAPSTAPAAR